jgi:transcriptional regulator with XRE-family HTH domain
VTTAGISPWSPLIDHAPALFGFILDAATITDVFKNSTAWIVLPDEPDDPASPLPRLIRETREMTGWAQRDLANVLRTSHTTVRRLETDGRVTARSRAIAARVAELHAVLVRLARVAGGPEALVVALAQTVRGTTALDLLREGAWSKAYTTALDAVRGPRPAMLGAAKAPVRAATREIRP